MSSLKEEDCVPETCIFKVEIKPNEKYTEVRVFLTEKLMKQEYASFVDKHRERKDLYFDLLSFLPDEILWVIHDYIPLPESDSFRKTNIKYKDRNNIITRTNGYCSLLHSRMVFDGYNYNMIYSLSALFQINSYFIFGLHSRVDKARIGKDCEIEITPICSMHYPTANSLDE